MGKTIFPWHFPSLENENLSCVKHSSDPCATFLVVAVSFPQKCEPVPYDIRSYARQNGIQLRHAFFQNMDSVYFCITKARSRAVSIPRRTPGHTISLYVKRCRYPSMAIYFFSSASGFFVSSFGILSLNTPLSYFAWISSCFISSPT